MSNLFYSLITFITALFFIVVGIVCAMLPWSATVRTALVEFILSDTFILPLFGLAVIIVGLAIVVHILLNTRRRYYYVPFTNHTVHVDEVVIQQYLNVYWKQLFPTQDTPCRLTIKNNKLHIDVELPYLPLAKQRPLLERIQEDLAALFKQTLGDYADFSLSASFQNQAATPN